MIMYLLLYHWIKRELDESKSYSVDNYETFIYVYTNYISSRISIVTYSIDCILLSNVIII